MADIVENEIKQFEGTQKKDDAKTVFSQKEYKLIDESLKEATTSSVSRHLMVITQDIEGAIGFIEESFNRQKRNYHTFLGSNFE